VVHVNSGADTGGIDAALAVGGSISGTVTDEATGDPLANICVDAFNQSGPGWRSAQTDASGNYTITGLPAGDYKVQFYDCNTGLYIGEWYNDKPDWSSADLVSVALGVNTGGINAQLGLPGSISGTVTDEATGDPLANICVNAFDASSGWSMSGAVTDASGNYTITGLPAGDYKVHFSDCNWPPVYAPEWYDDKPDVDSADIVHVNSGADTGGIDAALGRVPPCASPMEMALAIAAPGTVVLDAAYTGGPSQCAIFGPELQGFPTGGDTFLALSSGDAHLIPSGAPTPTAAPASALVAPTWAGAGAQPMNHAPQDVATLSVTVAVPPGATTLSFDWKFGTNEQAGSPYQDFFEAPNLLVTVDSAFPISSCPPVPPDVNFACFMTEVQTHSIDVTGLDQITISFTIGDDVDSIVDSAAFIDNLRFNSPAVTVRVGSGTVTPGGTITLPVEIVGAPAPGVGAVSVEAQFDPAVLDATGCTKDPNGVYDSGACNPDFNNDGAYPDSAKCVATSVSGVAGDSVVCEVTFGTVCQIGDTLTVHPVVVVLADPDGNPISYAVEDGTITCGLPGDVNCDSAVNVIDALFVLQYDVGLRSGSDQCPPPTGALYQSAGDVNCDNVVNVIDALFILQYDVGLTPNVPPGCPGPGGGFASPTATAALQQDRRPLNT